MARRSKDWTLRRISELELIEDKADWKARFDRLCDEGDPELWEAWCAVSNGPPDADASCDNFHSSLTRDDFFVRVVEASGLSEDNPHGHLHELFQKHRRAIRVARCAVCGMRQRDTAKFKLT